MFIPQKDTGSPPSNTHGTLRKREKKKWKREKKKRESQRVRKGYKMLSPGPDTAATGP